MRVPLTNSRKFAIIDDADWPLVKGHTWRLFKAGKHEYAAAPVVGKPGSTLLMHRLIMGAGRGQLIDHRLGDGLNNVRENLRSTDQSGNQQNRITRSSLNRSGVTGVFKDKRAGQWKATIQVNRATVIFPGVTDFQEAIEIRRAAEILAYGAFAPNKTEAVGKYVGKFDSLDDLITAFSRASVERGPGETGVKGVYRSPGTKTLRYVAMSDKAHGKVRLGLFDSVEAASTAVRIANQVSV